MLGQFVTVIHVFICCFLILIVLLQQGKGADAGATFGGSGQTFFGASGADNLLTKVTTFTAILFMCTSILLATSIQSDLSDQGEVMQMLETKPATPITAPVGVEAPVSDDSLEGSATSDSAASESAVSEDAATEEASSTATVEGVEITASETEDAGNVADEFSEPAAGAAVGAVETSEAANAAEIESTAGESQSTGSADASADATQESNPSTTSNANPMEGEAAQPQ